MDTFTVKKPEHYSLLEEGKLYRVDAARGDIVAGWAEQSFVPEWNGHQGNLKEALENIKFDIQNIRNMDLVLYCGTQKGYTLRDGNGTYFRFLYKEKTVFLSERLIATLVFCTLYDEK